MTSFIAANLTEKRLFRLSNRLILWVLVIISGALFVSAQSVLPRFMTLVFLLVLVILYARFSLFTVAAILVFLPYVGMVSQIVTNESYGVLELSIIPNNEQLLSYCLFIYLVSSLFWISQTLYIKDEQALLKLADFKTTLLGAQFSIVVALLSAVVAFPSAPFTRGFISGEHAALLPGNAWNHLSIVGILFALPKWRQSRLVRYGTYAVAVWFLCHFERVDIVGFFIGISIIIYQRSTSKRKFVYALRILAFVFIFVLLMAFIGEWRNNENITLSGLLHKLFIQNTACDVAYIFNLAAQYFNNGGLLHGSTYISYPYGLIPLLDAPISTVSVLSKNNFYPGGEYYFCEPIINFGLLGVLIVTNLEFAVLRLIVSSKTIWRYYIYVFVLMTQFRIIWYGRSYIETGLFIFVPIMYWITHRVLSSKKIK